VLCFVCPCCVYVWWLAATDLSYFTDVHFLKLFRLAQFTIEYLLHVQNYLASNLKEKEDRLVLAEALARDLQVHIVLSKCLTLARKQIVLYH
jgi:hypothetical protein